MRMNKLGIGLMTLLLALTAALCLKLDQGEREPVRETIPLSVTLTSSGEQIHLWQKAEGDYYVFLPAWEEPSQVEFAFSGSAAIGGIPLENGKTRADLKTGTAYAIRWEEGTQKREGQVTFLQSSGIPAVFLQTNSGSMAFIHGHKEQAEPGNLRVYDAGGSLDHSGHLDSVKGRGNATWELEKKPYNLTLQWEADILGMGSAKNWVLLANAMDDTGLRNKIVYDTALQVGMAFSPESRWVDLYLNGEYAGLYLLCEKNEIHPARVDLPENSGVLISIEKMDRMWAYGSGQFVTEAGIPVRVRSDAGDPAAVRKTVQAAERAILSPEGCDPETGKHWQELLDVGSWAEKYLIEEIFGNLDAGSISQFFYWDVRQETGKIQAGPVWDYDICLGNPHNWQLDAPRMLYSGRPHLWNPEDTPWFFHLYQKPEFRQQVAQLYESRFRPVLLRLLDSGIREYADTIAASADSNRLRWDTGDAAAETEAMQDYFSRRIAFLDSLWLEEKPYHLVSVYIQEHVMACYAVEDGETIPERPVPAGTDTILYEAWYDADTDQPYDFSQPINGDKLIYLKETNILSREDAGGFSLRTLITYVPFAALGVLLAAMALTEGHKNRKERGSEHAPANQQKISS